MFCEDTLADRAGLKKGDLVVEINDVCTQELSNEQLRKIMRNRLQMNEVKMRILGQHHVEEITEHGEKHPFVMTSSPTDGKHKIYIFSCSCFLYIL
jgi:C-terminal processing protease CtpA/Prc